MKLIHKLTLGFVSLALLLALVGAIQVLLIREIAGGIGDISHSNVGEVEGSVNIAHRVTLIGADISKYLLQSSNGLEDRKQELRRFIFANLIQLDKAVGAIREATSTGLSLADDDDDVSGETSELNTISELEELVLDYRNLIEQILQIEAAQGASSALALYFERNPSIENNIRSKSEALFNDALEEIDEEVSEVKEAVSRTTVYIAGLALLSFALAVIIGASVSRPLSKRIKQLQQATRSVQHGNLDVRIPTTKSNDEIAELTGAFNEMAANLKESTASIEDLNQQIEKRKQAEAALQNAHDELEVRVKLRTREYQNAKIEAESASRAKSDFLANMSHELRTPLNHIIGFTQVIVAEKIGRINEMQQEYLTDVLTSSRHLLALINDILDLSKVEAGKMELMPTKVNVHTLLNNCLAMFKEKAMNYRIELVLKAENAPDAVLADERQMKQVLYNLLSNAFKFTPDSGRICVKVWQINGNSDSRPEGFQLPGNFLESAAWAVAVTDSGIGIPSEDLERIFHPFEQADNQEDSRLEGTGLGLALTRKMVELHGGVIRAESSGRNQGTTFTVVLPEEAATPAM